MAHRQVAGVSWFVHSIVANELLARGLAHKGYALRPSGIVPLVGIQGVLVIADAVPIKYDAGSKTYSGGWSQYLDESASIYRRLTKV